MSITFAVDDVAPATERLPERDLAVATLASNEALGGSPATLRLVDPEGLPTARTHGGPPEDRMHALLQAVDLAFNEHRPLRLSPDVIWITLAQGFAIHVRENAEALRDRFVRHEGRAKVGVLVAEQPRGEAWRGFIEALSEATGDHLGPGVVALLTRPFSTTSEDARTVFRVALLDTFAPYFEYEEVLICGIPTITLEGTPDDWRDLRRRVEVMGEYDLRWWTDPLLALCDQWIATAEGRPDVEFWRSIHRPERIYGGHFITGWIARLFPYFEASPNRWERFAPLPARRIPEDATKPATFIEAAIRRALRRKAAEEGRGELMPWAIEGVSPMNLPSSWSQVEVVGRGLAEGGVARITGGLVGVAQDADGLTLSPAIAWLVDGSSEPALWAAFEARHAVTPRVDAPMRRASPFASPLRGALLAFYSRYERATLYGGAAEILPRDDGPRRRDAMPDEIGRWTFRGMRVFVRWAGGGALALVERPDALLVSRRAEPGLAANLEALGTRLHRIGVTLGWVVRIPDITASHARDCEIIAPDLWTFFRELAHREGPWFLDPGASSGRYVDRLRELASEG